MSKKGIFHKGGIAYIETRCEDGVFEVYCTEHEVLMREKRGESVDCKVCFCPHFLNGVSDMVPNIAANVAGK